MRPFFPAFSVASAGGLRPTPDPDAYAVFVSNEIAARSMLYKRLHDALDPRRDIDAECGYPAGSVDPERLYELFRYDPLAARTVSLYPRESWQVTPDVYEDDDPGTETAFEAAWAAVGTGLRGEGNWYKEADGNPVWEWLVRWDILAGVGRFGLLLLGFDDPAADDPAAPVAPGTAQALRFVRAVPEPLARVAAVNADPASPRYGRPEAYSVTVADPADPDAGGTTTATVHWTRVLHLYHGTAVGDVYGTSVLRDVLKPILAAQKLYGASAEGYWKSCFTALSLETDPSLGGEVNYDPAKLRRTMEDYQNGLQRVFALNGFTAKTLAPSVVDPSPHLDKQIELICIVKGCPVRVFKGSERGELASTQDDQAWNDRLRFHQKVHNTPKVVVPFVNRLIWAGVLPPPGRRFRVRWPDLASQTRAERAAVAATTTQALSAYVGGGVEALVPPADFLSKVMDFDLDDARGMLDRATADE